MKKLIIALTAAITVSATVFSGYVATLPNPTEAQTNLANAANKITITGVDTLLKAARRSQQSRSRRKPEARSKDKDDRDDRQEQSEEE